MPGDDNITDAIVAGSAGGELGDAIHASKRHKRGRPSAFVPDYPAGHCANCGTKLIGPVCHSCGQTAETFHRPIWELFLDVLDGLFGVEGRLWRTLPPLMLQPGKLTLRYLSGARASYVMPFRLYLTASVLFFLLVFAMNSFQGTGEQPGLHIDARDAAGNAVDMVESGALDQQLAEQGISAEQRASIENEVLRTIEGFSQGEVGDETPEEQAARQADQSDALKLAIRRGLLPENYPDPASETGAEPDAGPDGAIQIDGLAEMPLEFRERLADQADRIVNDGGESIFASMREWAPRLMFVLLPLYALLLAITHFYKRGYFFYDHLVVSLHFHSVLFFLFMIVFALRLVVGPGWAAGAFLLWSNYYLYRLHRVVYRHGRFSSLLRTLFMDFVYGVVLSIGMLVLLVIGLLSV